MSVAFASMELASGPTVGFKGQGPPPAAAASPTAAALVGVREFFGQVTAAAGDEGRGPGAAAAARQREEQENGAESSESSSIGVAGESSLSLSSSSTGDGGGDGEEEVQSKLKEGALGSLESLKECLPIKRGLSNCFAGKSKSFASLADAVALGSATELAKAENRLNKRRRLLMACKASWQRRASYAALDTCGGLRALEEEEEEDGEKGGGRGGCGIGDESPASSSPLIPLERKLGTTFRSPRSFSLSDLRHA